jgi:hypothetical protein
MVAAGADMCGAFRFLAGSTGTEGCVRRAFEASLSTYLIDSEKAEPRRLQEGDGRLSRARRNAGAGG